MHSLNQFFLDASEHQIRPVMALTIRLRHQPLLVEVHRGHTLFPADQARKARFAPNDQDDQIGFLGTLHRFSEALAALTHDGAPLGVAHFHLGANLGLNPLQHGYNLNGVLLRIHMGVIGVVALDGAGAVGVGTDHRKFLDILGQGQQAILVFQQDDGLVGRLPGQGALFRRLKDHAHPFRLNEDFIEQPQLELELKMAPHGVIHNRFRNQSVQHSGYEQISIALNGGAFYIQPRLQGHDSRPAQILRHQVVFVEQADAVVVRYHNPFKPQLAAQDVREQLPGTGAGYTVNGVVSIHHGAGFGFPDGCFVGEDMHFPQLPGGEVDRSVVSAAFRRTVPREMLQGAHHTGAQIIALQPPDISRTHAGHQVRIFAKGFFHPAPAEIPSHVHHGREAQVGPDGPHLFADLRGHSFHELRFKAAAHPDGLGIDRAAGRHESAQAFFMDQGGNTQAGLGE